MQEEEIKILSTSLLIFHSWLQALDSSWMRGTVLEAWAFCVPLSVPAENKSRLSISSKLCLCIFHSTSVAKEDQDFDQQ